jgi:hypothetical protein
VSIVSQLYALNCRRDSNGLEGKTTSELELEFLADAFAQHGEDPRGFYVLTPAERDRREADKAKGDWRHDGEDQADWDARVLAARRSRGEDIGEWFAEASGDRGREACALDDPETHPCANYGESVGDFGYGGVGSEGCCIPGLDVEDPDPLPPAEQKALYWETAKGWMCAPCLRAKAGRPTLPDGTLDYTISCPECVKNAWRNHKERAAASQKMLAAARLLDPPDATPASGGALLDDFDDLWPLPAVRGVHYSRTVGAPSAAGPKYPDRNWADIAAAAEPEGDIEEERRKFKEAQHQAQAELNRRAKAEQHRNRQAYGRFVHGPRPPPPDVIAPVACYVFVRRSPVWAPTEGPAGEAMFVLLGRVILCSASGEPRPRSVSFGRVSRRSSRCKVLLCRDSGRVDCRLMLRRAQCHCSHTPFAFRARLPASLTRVGRRVARRRPEL